MEQVKPERIRASFKPEAWTKIDPRRREELTKFTSVVAPGLPPSDAQHLTERLYFPLCDWWARAVDERRVEVGEVLARPLVVSLGGLPGTGKSTLARVAGRLLEDVFGQLLAVFSLDDIYLTGSQREELGRRVHPLFRFRGVPGTHDLALGWSTLNALQRAQPGDVTPLPRFDKLADERKALAEWPRVHGRPDVILIEGWCWGAMPAPATALDEPINAREARDDPDGRWRRRVNELLGEDYPDLFAVSDLHVQLEAPAYRASVEWRVEQGRQALIERGEDPDQVDPSRIAEFLELFERVGRLPRRPMRGIVVRLDDDHRIATVEATP